MTTNDSSYSGTLIQDNDWVYVRSGGTAGNAIGGVDVSSGQSNSGPSRVDVYGNVINLMGYTETIVESTEVSIVGHGQSSDHALTVDGDGINLDGYDLGGQSGNRWGVVPVVESDAGVMEVGQYIDFHASDSDSSDYTARINCDSAGRFYFNNVALPDIQRGSYSIPAGSGISGTGYKDYTFSFGRAFASAPTVVACLAGGSTAGEMGSISVGVYQTTTTTCTIRLWANGVVTARNPTIRWIAVG